MFKGNAGVFVPIPTNPVLPVIYKSSSISLDERERPILLVAAGDICAVWFASP